MEIKNRTYYFHNDLINIKDFDSRLLKLDKKTSVGFGIYYIGYVTKNPEWNVNSVNPLYLIINRIGSFIVEINGDKYLNIVSTDRNSEVLKSIQKFGMKLKIVLKKINNIKLEEYDRNSEMLKSIQKFGMKLKIVLKKINNSKLEEYDKDYMKIKFNPDDYIPLNKVLNFPTITVIIRNIFEKDGKYYPQSFLDECLHEV